MKIYTLAFLIVIPFLYGCSDSLLPTESQLDSSVNGKIIKVVQNSNFSLELDLHADGGYRWDCMISDSTVVRIDSTHSRPKDSGEFKVGGLSVERFYFSSRKTGRCLIDLIEHQRWEKDVPPINIVQFNVIVK
jgi:predicted secreted protein